VAITFFGQAHVPTDNDATGNSGTTVTVTPPGSMVANDYVVVVVSYRTNSSSRVLSVSDAGGQTWVSGTQINSGVLAVSRVFHCRYDGTWDANPVFAVDTGTNPLSAGMLVFRGVDTTTAIDVAESGASYSAPGTPFDVTIPEITTATNGAMAVAIWVSGDDNTWTVQTGSWTQQTPGQTRNLAGSDQSHSMAWLVFASAGGTGSVTNRQSVVTGDSGNYHILALKPLAGTSATVTTTKSDLALGSTSATIGAASAVTTTKSDLALGTSTATLAASVSDTVTTTKSDLALGNTSATATATGSIATTLSTLALGNTTATLVAQVNDSVTTTKSDLALGSTSATVSAGSSIATTLSTLALGNTTAGLSAGTHATVTTTTSDLALGSASATVAASASVICTVGNMALAGPGVTLTAAVASASRVQGYV
jgi:hypothetical protein